MGLEIQIGERAGLGPKVPSAHAQLAAWQHRAAVYCAGAVGNSFEAAVAAEGNGAERDGHQTAAVGCGARGSAEQLYGPEGAGGQRVTTQKIEGLMEMVKKLQKVGSLEPRIEVLINRINEVQQAKRKASEELGEAQTVWDTLQKDLDSLLEEKARLKDIWNKKQETLKVLRLQCQEKESETQRKHSMLHECKERISFLNSQIDKEKDKLRQLRLEFEEQLEALMSQHKDLLEFHKPEHLANEICALDSSKEQLLKEEKLMEVKLEDVKHRLYALCGPEGPSTLNEGLFLRSHEAATALQLFKEENKKAEELLEAAAQHHQQLQQRCLQLQQKRQRLKEELEKHGLQILAQVQSMQDEGDNSQRMASPKPLGVHEEKDQECPPSRT